MLCMLFCSLVKAQNYLKLFNDYYYAPYLNIRTDGLPVTGLSDYYHCGITGLDYEGNELWTKSYDAAVLRSFILDDNAQIVFYSDFDNLLIDKISETGEVLWTTSYSADALGFDSFIDTLYENNSVTKNSDNEYALLLTDYDGVCDWYELVIPRFDAAGELINVFNVCHNDYTLPDFYSYFNHILSSPDMVTLVGSQQSAWPDYDYYASIINFNEDGSFNSQKDYPGFAIDGASQLSDGYLIYGWYQNATSPYDDHYAGYYFMRTDFNGDTLWVNRYPEADRLYPMQARITDAGNIISVLQNEDYELFLQKNNSDATIAWSTYLNYSESYASALDLEVINEARFAICGYMDPSFGYGSSYVFVTDSTAVFPEVEIQGKAYYDENDNNIYDGSEIGLSWQWVTTDPGGTLGYTNYDGNYEVHVYEDVPEISIYIDPSSLFVQSFPAAGGPNIIEPDVSSGYYFEDNVNFAEQFVTEGLNLTTNVYAWGMVPGFGGFAEVYIHNSGSVSVDEGTVTLTHPSKLSLVYTEPPYTSYTDTTITWVYNDLGIFDYQFFDVFLMVDESLGLDYPLQFTSTINPTAGDIDITNNYDTTNTETTSSWDPNNKIVDPAGEGSEGYIDVNTPKLTYDINFQNTGTSAAHFVVLIDTLSDDLDLYSMQMLTASHTCEIEIIQPNIIKWIFNDINLPDSTTDLLGSMGHVRFSINIKEDASAGTVINNSAAIYFDYNEPVITNTTRNTLRVENVSVIDQNTAQQLVIYPNPVSGDVLNIITDKDMTNAVYKVTDLAGKLVCAGIIKGSSIPLQGTGIFSDQQYLLTIMTANTVINKPFMYIK